MKGHPWTAEDLATLHQMRCTERADCSTIAKVLSRTESAVKQKLNVCRWTLPRDPTCQPAPDAVRPRNDLIELGSLVQMAGLVELMDDDRTVLLGAFLDLAARLQHHKNGRKREIPLDLMTRWRRRAFRFSATQSQRSGGLRYGNAGAVTAGARLGQDPVVARDTPTEPTRRAPRDLSGPIDPRGRS